MKSQAKQFKEHSNFQRRLFCLFGTVTIFIGCYLRLGGLFSHVTYIDEILLLSEGKLIPNDDEIAQISDRSSLRYVLNTAIAPTNSYAPLTLFVARVLQGPKMFSMKALKILRFVSAIFSCLSLLLFAHLTFLYSGRRFTSAWLWIVTLFTCQMAQWINAKQGHPYSAGVFSLLLVLELFEVAQMTQSFFSIALFFLGALVALMIQYQVSLWVVAVVMIGFISILVEKKPSESFLKISPLQIAFITLGLFALAEIACLSLFKTDLMIPWWVKDFMNPTNFSLIAGWKSLFLNVLGVFKLMHLTHLGGENLLLSIAGLLLVSFGLVIVLRTLQISQSTDFWGPKCLLVLLLIWLGAYLVGRTPISPTRHALIYMVPLLIFELLGLNWIIDKIPYKKVWNVLIATASLTVLSTTLVNFPQYLIESKETFSLEKLEIWMKDFKTRNCATWAYDLSKVKLMTQSSKDKIEHFWAWPGHLQMLPKKKMLFIETSTHAGAMNETIMASSPQFHFKKLVDNQNHFDFEPMEKVKYGSNVFRVWMLTPK